MSKAGDQARKILRKASASGNKMAKKALAKDKARRSKTSSRSSKSSSYSRKAEETAGMKAAEKLLKETKDRIAKEKLKRENKLRIDKINADMEKRKISKYLKTNWKVLDRKQKSKLVKYRQDLSNYSGDVTKYLKQKKVYDLALKNTLKKQLQQKKQLDTTKIKGIKLATYKQVFGNKPITKPKINLITPNFKSYNFKLNKSPQRPVSLDIKNAQSLMRSLKGEELVKIGDIVAVKTKTGTRKLTQKEMKELNQAQNVLNLNPINVVTGFFGATRTMGNLVTGRVDVKNAVKQVVTHPTSVITNTLQEIATNPFGFVGESVAYSGAGKLVGKILKGTVKPLKKIKTANTKRIEFLKNQIKKLESEGVNVRARDLKSKKYRLYKEELKVIQMDLIDLNRAITKLEKTKPTTKALKKTIKEIKPIQKKFKIRKTKRVKIIDNKKALKEMLKVEKKPKIKVIKTLPNNPKILNKMLEDARLDSGLAFKHLKVKIKKELSYNVKFRKGKPVVLKPKDLKIIKPTGKKAKVKTIRLEPKIKKVKSKTQAKPLTKKEIKELEFKEGQNLDKLQKDFRRIAKQQESQPKTKKVILMNKKAHMTMSRTFKRHYTKTEKTIKTLFKRTKDFSNGYKRQIKNANRIKNLNKRKFKTAQIKKTYQKRATKIKQQVKIINKRISTLNKIFKTLSVLIPISLTKSFQATNQFQAMKQALDQVQKQIHEFEKIKVPKPKSPSIPKKPTKPTPPKPKLRIKPSGSKPTKPTPPKPKPRIKPKTKLPIKPKIKIQINKLSKSTKGKMGMVTFKIGNKTKTIRTGLPYNKALRFAKDTIDNTLLASMVVKAYGKTRKKDIRRPKLNKFRLKVGKNSLVQKVVEKSKYRLDTRGEKKEIQIKNYIKKKLKMRRL